MREPRPKPRLSPRLTPFQLHFAQEVPPPLPALTEAALARAGWPGLGQPTPWQALRTPLPLLQTVRGSSSVVRGTTACPSELGVWALWVVSDQERGTQKESLKDSQGSSTAQRHPMSAGSLPGGFDESHSWLPPANGFLCMETSVPGDSGRHPERLWVPDMQLHM